MCGWVVWFCDVLSQRNRLRNDSRTDSIIISAENQECKISIIPKLLFCSFLWRVFYGFAPMRWSHSRAMSAQRDAGLCTDDVQNCDQIWLFFLPTLTHKGTIGLVWKALVYKIWALSWIHLEIGREFGLRLPLWGPEGNRRLKCTKTQRAVGRPDVWEGGKQNWELMSESVKMCCFCWAPLPLDSILYSEGFLKPFWII